MSDFVYNAEAQTPEGAVLLDLEAQGWANKELLAKTTRWSLVPKEGETTVNGQKFPIIVVNIPEGGKPIFKSRKTGTIASSSGSEGPGFRAYAVGYHLNGTSHWTWVMPTGDVEIETDDPWLADLYLASLKGRAPS